jgi:hypothetical protein
VGAALHVRLEVAGVERQVHLPGARGLLVLLELAVDARQVEQRLPVARPQAHDLLVVRGRAPQRGLRVGSGRLDLLELREHQVGVGVVRIERDRSLGFLQGLVEAAHLAQQARRLDPDRGRGRIELLRPPIRCERLVDVAREPLLQPQAVLVVGLGARRGL